MTIPQVKLRAMEPEDLELLYTIENDPQMWEVSCNNVPYSRYVLHDYIANSRGDAYADRQVRLIVENGVGDTVGLADLTSFDAKHRRAEIGIAIVSEYRHHGYGISAVMQLCDYALRVLHVHQLYAIIPLTHEQSLKMFERVGFQQSAILKEWLFDGFSYQDAAVMQRFLQKNI